MLWLWAFGLTVTGWLLVAVFSPPRFTGIGQAVAWHLTHEKNPLVGVGRAFLWLGLIVLVAAMVSCGRGLTRSAAEQCIAAGGQAIGGATGVVCVSGTPEGR